MKRRFVIASMAGMAVFVADAAYAQWLNPHLDSQRWSNLRKHQQRQRQRSVERQKPPDSTPNATPLTLAERQAAWSRNKAEYRRRMLRDGQASADRWLDLAALARR